MEANDRSKDTKNKTGENRDKNQRPGSTDRQNAEMTLRKRDIKQEPKEHSAFGSSWCSEVKSSNKQRKIGQETFKPIVRSVNVIIKADGRYYTPVKLITQGVEWPSTIFCDTGATNSIIREDTLEKFQKFVRIRLDREENDNNNARNKNVVDIIKIKSQNFGGAFNKVDAKAQRMVQLDIAFEQTNGHRLTLKQVLRSE